MMKANKMIAAVVATTMISGYVNTVLQTTNGYNNIFKKARQKLHKRFAIVHTTVIDSRVPNTKPIKQEYEDTDGTWAELATCPWCFSPWVTLPVYLGVIAILKPEANKREHLLGYAVSTAAAAFQRVNGIVF